jgi:O-antigen/teichoic acid export membrane protein
MMRPLVVSTPSSSADSYGQILRSTALIGASSVATVALGVVRTKAMAVLLGPAGVGLFGLYGSIAELTQSVAGMGVNSSGVRQIAAAVGSGDTDRIARTAAVLRRTSLILGALGALWLVVFSREISTLTFGSDHRATGVALLSVAVLLRLVAAGQAALIQGMRRIADLAMLGVWGALGGTIVTIPAVYLLGENGVVPSLVAVAATSIVTSWWYSRRVRIPAAAMTLSELWPEAAPLLKLGFAFMASGLLTIGAAYVIRITVLRTLGIEAAGLYQAAWAVGGLYVAFILQPMGADFYPRLTAAAANHPECNRLVNEQTHVGLLLAGPAAIATLTAAPLVIVLLYSSAFLPAVELLRWFCLGMALQVITWPVGFIVLAKGEQRLFLLIDLAWTLVHVGLAWAFVRSYGVNGAGIAFFGSYIFHGLVVYPLGRRLTGFRWSSEIRRSGLLFLVLIAAAFSAFAVLPPAAATIVGGVALAVGGAYSLRVLFSLLRADQRLPRRLRALLVRLRLVTGRP